MINTNKQSLDALNQRADELLGAHPVRVVLLSAPTNDSGAYAVTDQLPNVFVSNLVNQLASLIRGPGSYLSSLYAYPAFE